MYITKNTIFIGKLVKEDILRQDDYFKNIEYNPKERDFHKKGT